MTLQPSVATANVVVLAVCSVIWFVVFLLSVGAVMVGVWFVLWDDYSISIKSGAYHREVTYLLLYLLTPVFWPKLRKTLALD